MVIGSGCAKCKDRGIKAPTAHVHENVPSRPSSGVLGLRFESQLYEEKNGSFERASKHYIIAANLGCDFSLQQVKGLFVQGVVSEEEHAAALRGHQASVDAMKSAEMDEAEEALKR